MSIFWSSSSLATSCSDADPSPPNGAVASTSSAPTTPRRCGTERLATNSRTRPRGCAVAPESLDTRVIVCRWPGQSVPRRSVLDVDLRDAFAMAEYLLEVHRLDDW